MTFDCHCLSCRCTFLTIVGIPGPSVWWSSKLNIIIWKQCFWWHICDWTYFISSRKCFLGQPPLVYSLSLTVYIISKWWSIQWYNIWTHLLGSSWKTIIWPPFCSNTINFLCCCSFTGPWTPWAGDPRTQLNGGCPSAEIPARQGGAWDKTTPSIQLRHGSPLSDWERISTKSFLKTFY